MILRSDTTPRELQFCENAPVASTEVIYFGVRTGAHTNRRHSEEPGIRAGLRFSLQRRLLNDFISKNPLRRVSLLQRLGSVWPIGTLVPHRPEADLGRSQSRGIQCVIASARRLRARSGDVKVEQSEDLRVVHTAAYNCRLACILHPQWPVPSPRTRVHERKHSPRRIL